MYRISVSTLEKFRRYLAEVSDYDTEADLIASIKGEFKGNDKTHIGGACHKVIEGDFSRSWINKENCFLADDIAFTGLQALPFLAFKKAHPVMVHEVSLGKVYQLRDQQIYVSGRTDGLEGRIIRDTKCQFKVPDFQAFADSFQWRLYLDIWDLSSFAYDVFEVKGFDAVVGEAPFLLPGVEFIGHEPMFLYGYRAMQDECTNLVQQFMDYIRLKDFYSYLKTKNETIVL